jgi:hypothetical protein
MSGGGRSYRVRVFSVSLNNSSKKPTTWSAGKSISSVLADLQDQELADRFRSRLVRAMEDGESFDITTGLHDSMAEAKADVTLYAFARAYVDMKWTPAAAKSRASMTETSMTALPVRDVKGQPGIGTLRTALRWHALPPTRRGIKQPREIANALAWLEKTSLPVEDLKEANHVHSVVDALGRKLDGTAAPAETTRPKRTVLYNVLDYAVELGHLDRNPIDQVKRKRIIVTEVVDRRAVASPAQARELHTALSYVGGFKRAGGRTLVAFYRGPVLRGHATGGGGQPAVSGPQAPRKGPRPGHIPPDAADGRKTLDGQRRGTRRPRTETARREGHPAGSDPAGPGAGSSASTLKSSGRTRTAALSE